MLERLRRALGAVRAGRAPASAAPTPDSESRLSAATGEPPAGDTPTESDQRIDQARDRLKSEIPPLKDD